MALYQLLNYVGQVIIEGTQEECEKVARRKSKSRGNYGYRVINTETKVYDVWRGGELRIYARVD